VCFRERLDILSIQKLCVCGGGGERGGYVLVYVCVCVGEREREREREREI